MSKTVDLAVIGNALIAQTKQLEHCFQNSMMSSEASEVEDFSLSINTLGRLISQLTVRNYMNLFIFVNLTLFSQLKIAERDYEREFLLKENQKLHDNAQK